ncbi:uncharacterized protein LOC104233387 [Acetobacter orientalis]|uniref:Uncharacterized protein LOC104233387 n=1 Tax=Acetobacter orientalis TaxID=146474 RepID=A0A2Z5ZLZ8_9PROT|nr:uncharacterized protein LOC104233387 [Acetobacter orientalis]
MGRKVLPHKAGVQRTNSLFGGQIWPLWATLPNRHLFAT